MLSQLIGYFPKKTAVRPDWLKAGVVAEICSASCCVSQGPEGWIDAWLHNEMWVYDSPAVAWSVVPQEEKSLFQMYAFKMIPLKFDQGQQLPTFIPAMEVTALERSFIFLGYDAVSRSYENSFECSPLSCNHFAEKIQTNEFCLIDDPEQALRVAMEFSTGGAEPGPYFIVEVWREACGPC